MFGLEDLISLFGQKSILALAGPFLLLIACGVGLPVPEDIILVSAGFLGARSSVPVWATAALMYLGIVIGDGLIYGAGRWGGQRFIRSRLGQRLLPPEKVAQVSAYFKRWGTGVIFVGRFMPGLRAPIYLSAGTLHYSATKFFLIDGLAALISAPFFVWLGHQAWVLFGNDIDAIEEKMGRANIWIIAGALALAIVIFAVVWFRSQKKKNHEEVRSS